MAESEQKPRILIVEDHPIIAELVETRLRIEGMDPIKCPGGREALEIIGTQPLDAVILDIMMPDVDGYEVLRHIRSQPATRRLPVIFLTARSTPADIEKGLAMGANYYITKPFSGLDLVRKVRICLEERRAAAPSRPPCDEAPPRPPRPRRRARRDARARGLERRGGSRGAAPGRRQDLDRPRYLEWQRPGSVPPRHWRHLLRDQPEHRAPPRAQDERGARHGRHRERPDERSAGDHPVLRPGQQPRPRREGGNPRLGRAAARRYPRAQFPQQLRVRDRRQAAHRAAASRRLIRSSERAGTGAPSPLRLRRLGGASSAVRACRRRGAPTAPPSPRTPLRLR